MKILLTIEYDGTAFCGWQIQPGKRTVQGTLTEALRAVFKKDISLHGSGRTDAGVHAFNQKAHFEIDSLGARFPLERIPFALNTKLPPDVSVKKAEQCEDDFEAQYSAKKKTYVYRFYVSPIPFPLLSRTATQVPYPPAMFDDEKAKAVLEKIRGTHDFAAFSSTGRSVKTSVRTIYEASFSREETLCKITVTGNGFLYNMVRILVGTVIEVALSQRPLTDVDEALVTKNRLKCGKTFPACGLTLQDVLYE